MKVRHFAYCAALAATLAQPVAASAQEQMCLTREEVRTGLSYVTPVLIEGFVKICTPFLTEDSQLLQLGPAMAEKYKAVGGASDEDAMALFMKIGGVTGDMPPDLPIESFKEDVWLSMAKDINSDECTIAESIMPDLEALPAANMIGLVENILHVVELQDRQKKAKRSKKPIAPSIFCDE